MSAQKTAPVLPSIRTVRNHRWSAGIAAILFLVLLGGLARWQIAIPKALGADAPATQFSAARALKHIEIIAREPHPTGTPANAAVREYIVRELAAAGLTPEIHDSVALYRGSQRGTSVGLVTVRNIVARLKGTEPGKALVLAAHYDSVPTAPGASDDGAGVAAILETLRAIKSGPPLKNDIIILISDGEELGILGARAWVREHPWARDAGLFLNFEMRGTAGPALMFEVSEGNGALLQEFARAVPYPSSNSLAYAIYRLMPNDTDVTAFKTLPDVAYFNVAAIEGGRRYHSSLDDIAHVQTDTLQHMGSYALGVARHFGNRPLPPERTGDGIWFNAVRWWLVQYPAAWALPLAVVVCLLLLALLVQGVRWKVVALKEIAIGLIPLPLSLSLMAAVTFALPGLTNGAPWPDLLPPAYMALGAVLVLAAYGLFSRWAGTAALMAAALVWWAAAAVVSAVMLPGGSYLFLWPLLFGLAGFLFVQWVGEERAVSLRGLVVLSLCLVPVSLLVMSLTGTFYEALHYLPQAASALFMLVLGLAPAHMIALLRAFRAWLPAGLLLAAAALLAGSLLLPATAEHPAKNTLYYGWDADAGKGWWLAGGYEQDEWTKDFLTGVQWQDEAHDFFPLGGYYYKGAAEPVALGAPVVQLLANGEQGGERVLRLNVKSGRGAGLLGIYVDQGVAVKEASVAGRSFKGEDRPWSMLWIAPPAEGVELQVRVPAGSKFAFRVIDGSLGLPGGTAARPAHLIPGSYGADWRVPSDSTLVAKKFSF